ncbi:three-Cys-motif partner protein [Elusimicrobium simillimum]|uniref:three-Cys-motif partner protein TcmP n=1 Tax=Elusimicrobium simillimum TaxID=3143438 RepID=UPI003C6FD5DA
MNGKMFFKKQSNVTFLKTLIYEKYISSYLSRMLTQTKKIYIADLCCGSGKNAKNNGSPLILIDIIKDLFKRNKLLCSTLEIEVIFNDSNKDLIKTLKWRISQEDLPPNAKITFYCSKYEVLIKKIVPAMEADSYKFFFLDTFYYTQISLENLKTILNAGNAEILLFFPIAHMFRFSNYYTFKGKGREFFETYTTKGCYRYKTVYDFTESIRKKLSSQLKTKWVRDILLKDSNRINGLFLISEQQESMVAINNIFWNYTGNGLDISIDNYSKYDLPITNRTIEAKKILSSFKNALIDKIAKGTKDLKTFAALKKISCTHLKTVLNDLLAAEKIKKNVLLG